MTVVLLAPACVKGPDPIPVDRHHAALATQATIPLIWVWKAFRPGLAEGVITPWGFAVFLYLVFFGLIFMQMRLWTVISANA